MDGVAHLPMLRATHRLGQAHCSKCSSTRLKARSRGEVELELYQCDCVGWQPAIGSFDGERLDEIITCMACGTQHRPNVDSPMPASRNIGM